MQLDPRTRTALRDLRCLLLNPNPSDPSALQPWFWDGSEVGLGQGGEVELIDSHVHLLEPDRFHYAWCAGEPHLGRRFSRSDYGTAAAGIPGARVESIVVMEADVAPERQDDETAYFSGLPEAQEGEARITALIAGAWPERPDFPERIAALARNPRVRGVRRVLHTQPAALMAQRGVVENLQRLPEFGFTFDLCLRPHQLEAAAQLARRCPETEFVLDHCGVPDIARGGFEAWAEAVRRVADCGNVTCKFSGLAGCCDPARPLLPQVSPYFESCVARFGVDRLMWGSDWPLCDLRAWVAASVALIATLPSGAQDAVARATARRVYRLPGA